MATKYQVGLEITADGADKAAAGVGSINSQLGKLADYSEEGAAAAAGLSRELDAIKKAEAANAALQGLARATEDLTAALAEADAKSAELATQQQAATAANDAAEQAFLDQTIAMQRMVQAGDGLKASLAASDAALAELTSAQSKANAALRQSEADHKAAEQAAKANATALGKVRQEAADLSGKLQGAKDESRALTAEFKGQMEAVNLLGKRQQQYATELRGAESALATSKARLADYASELKRLQDAYKTDKSTEAAAKVEAYRLKVDLAKQEAAGWRAEISRLNAAVTENGRQTESAWQSIAKTQDALAKAEEKTRQYRVEMGRANGDAGKLEANQLGLGAAVAKAAADLERAQQAAAESAAETKKAAAAQNELKTAIAANSATLKKEQDELARRTATLKSAGAESAKLAEATKRQAAIVAELKAKQAELADAYAKAANRAKASGLDTENLTRNSVTLAGRMAELKQRIADAAALHGKAGDAAKKHATGQDDLATSMLRNVGAMAAGTVGVYQLVAAYNAAVEAQRKQLSIQNGLKAASKKSGESVDAIAEAAKRLGSYTGDMLNFQDAALSLKNLLSRGYNLKQAEDAIRAISDSAAFGRASHLGFGEAIITATEGLKNENSELVDNSGITKNVAKMWDEYARAIGTTADKLTQQQKVLAEVAGLNAEAGANIGDAAKAAAGAEGDLARYEASLNRLAVALGKALLPQEAMAKSKLGAFFDSLVPSVEKVADGLNRTGWDVTNFGVIGLTQNILGLNDGLRENAEAQKEAAAAAEGLAFQQAQTRAEQFESAVAAERLAIATRESTVEAVKHGDAMAAAKGKTAQASVQLATAAGNEAAQLQATATAAQSAAQSAREKADADAQAAAKAEAMAQTASRDTEQQKLRALELERAAQLARETANTSQTLALALAAEAGAAQAAAASIGNQSGLTAQLRQRMQETATALEAAKQGYASGAVSLDALQAAQTRATAAQRAYIDSVQDARSWEEDITAARRAGMTERERQSDIEKELRQREREATKAATEEERQYALEKARSLAKQLTDAGDQEAALKRLFKLAQDQGKKAAEEAEKSAKANETVKGSVEDVEQAVKRVFDKKQELRVDPMMEEAITKANLLLGITKELTGKKHVVEFEIRQTRSAAQSLLDEFGAESRL